MVQGKKQLNSKPKFAEVVIGAMRRRKCGDMELITYVADRKGHDMRYAIDYRKLQKKRGWEPSFLFEEGIEETVK